jgi:phospholipid-binding lipoprotein MlaA
MSRPHAPLFTVLLLCAAVGSALAQEAPTPSPPDDPATQTPVDATTPEQPVPEAPVPAAPVPSEPLPTQPAPAEPANPEPPVDPAPIDLPPRDTPPGPPASETPPADAIPVDGEPPAEPTDGDPRTAAEREYDALYADPTLPAPAALPESYDPWEPFNRRMHRFNSAVDRRVARPLAQAYVAVVPRPVRLGVSNFFSNLGQPVTAVNSLLQGKPKQAAQALGRFMLNSTLGIGGIFDPANDANLPQRREDFGQTLGVWGWKQSRYVELPLFGPRTLRDVFGMSADAPFAPIRRVEEDRIRYFLQGLQLVDVRTQLLAVDSMREGATDEYALVRDAWLQRRQYQIFGDRLLEDDASLPDYLREEHNPTVPIDAIPVTPMDGG